MVRVEVGVRFSDISEFGYIPFKGQKATEKSKGKLDLSPFGSVGVTLSEMKTWLEQKDLWLGNSTTCEPDASGLRIFGSKVVEQGGDWFMTLVEEVPRSTKGVNIFKFRSVASRPEATSVPVHADEFAGFATHFWFLPDRSQFASVRVDPIWPSTDRMRDYVRGFMARHSPILGTPDGERVLAKSPAGVYLACKVRFESAVDRDGNNTDAILHGKVTGIFLRETIETFLPKARRKKNALLQRFSTTFKNVLGPRLPSAEDSSAALSGIQRRTARVECILSTPLAEGEVRELIAGWEQRNDGWNNLGFDVSTGGKPSRRLWVRKAIKRATAELDLTVDEHGIVDTASLARQLSKQREAILKAADSAAEPEDEQD